MDKINSFFIRKYPHLIKYHSLLISIIVLLFTLIIFFTIVKSSPVLAYNVDNERFVYISNERLGILYI